jgi:hypothetical protein
MRKRTLVGVCVVLSLAILIALRFLGISVGVGMAPFAVYLVLVPLLMAPMTLLNKRLLTWRKARGRDIAQEEEYEIGETGIISLRSRPDRPTQSDENKYLPLLFR